VNEFKYLGILLYNDATKPTKIIKARLNAAKRSFFAVCTNCRMIGITNVKVKLLLVNALVRSVMLYGCILYACMSDVTTTLTPTNSVFA
jgi:uncharacterized membrane protein YkgB